MQRKFTGGYDYLWKITRDYNYIKSFTAKYHSPYINPKHEVISSTLATVPCTSLGIQGILNLLNVILQTHHTLEKPSVSSLLKDCISNDYDFGMAYGRLRHIWKTDTPNEQHLRELEDQPWQYKALPEILLAGPRRVWDLYSNRVVPWWIGYSDLCPISHAWVDVKDRVDVWTPINGNEWPVPIPKDTDLRLIRIEMLNLGLEHVWLDVLCLRQEGGPREDLRVEEWKLDVPTIGDLYDRHRVVIYMSGLGRPLSLKEGDLDSDRSWFRRAWTLQEIGIKRVIAGDTPDGPLHDKPIDENGNYKTETLTQFYRQLSSLEQSVEAIFPILKDMQGRVSTKPIDKVAGLVFPLKLMKIIPYYESQSLEETWTTLVNLMRSTRQIKFLFFYPEAGQGSRKWIPTWEQVMTGPLPENVPFSDGLSIGTIEHDYAKNEDWFNGPCIEKGMVQGLDIRSVEGGYQCGELDVEDEHGMMHTFKIVATHQYPILEDTYTLLGEDYFQQYWAVGRRLPEQRFEKVSVLELADKEDVQRLKDLGIIVKSHNLLI